MKHWKFRYYLKEGISNFFSHRFMTVAAITVITACLLITSGFSMLAYNLDIQVAELETQSEIMVWVDETYTPEQSEALGSSIRALSNVQSAEYIPKDVGLEQYKEELGEDGYLLEGLEEDNPLRDGYRVTMRDISKHTETVEQLQQITGVADTDSQKEFSDKLIQIRRVVNIICYTLIAMLGAVSIFIISNTVKLAMFARREEIAIMRMVGATNHFIRMPFIVEGLVLGEIVALLAFGLDFVVYNYLAEGFINATGLVELVSFSTFAVPLLLIVLAAGLVVGVGGSVLTIRKFLKV